MDDNQLRVDLSNERFPRCDGYDPRWLLENEMGPNVLWLTEAVTQVVELTPGMNVLDLGCGRAVSSIFLAREFDVQVWACDLWIDVESNRLRIAEAGLTESITPVWAEAHSLPFDRGFFDVILSIDAYHYFGTDDLYIGYITQFLRPGGTLAICVPGLRQELPDGPPPWIAPYWQWDFCSFHSPQWWRRHWEKTGLVTLIQADMLPDGWELWVRWLETLKSAGQQLRHEGQIEMVRVDAGRTLGFSRVVATRSEPPLEGLFSRS